MRTLITLATLTILALPAAAQDGSGRDRAPKDRHGRDARPKDEWELGRRLELLRERLELLIHRLRHLRSTDSAKPERVHELVERIERILRWLRSHGPKDVPADRRDAGPDVNVDGAFADRVGGLAKELEALRDRLGGTDLKDGAKDSPEDRRRRADELRKKVDGMSGKERGELRERIDGAHQRAGDLLGADGGDRR